MLLAVDIGNTDITFGVFKGKKMIATFRVNTQQIRTSDEYGMIMCDLLEHNKVPTAEISDAIVASTVPKVMHALTSGIIKYFQTRPIIVEAGVKTGVRIVAKGGPKQIGPDRIADAAAVFELYGGPAIIIDYGTATTYTLIDEDGSFMACVIAPGLRSSAESMWSQTANLPEFEIRTPKSILAQDTISGMQAGLMFGAIGQTEYIVNKMKTDFGKEDIKVVATGGFGKLMQKETTCIELYDPTLTLQGLRIIFEKQEKKNK